MINLRLVSAVRDAFSMIRLFAEEPLATLTGSYADICIGAALKNNQWQVKHWWCLSVSTQGNSFHHGRRLWAPHGAEEAEEGADEARRSHVSVTQSCGSKFNQVDRWSAKIHLEWIPVWVTHLCLSSCLHVLQHEKPRLLFVKQATSHTCRLFKMFSLLCFNPTLNLRSFSTRPFDRDTTMFTGNVSETSNTWHELNWFLRCSVQSVGCTWCVKKHLLF